MATKLDDPRDIQGAYESQFNKLNQAEKSSDKAYGHPKENKNKDSVDNVDDSAREARDEEQKQAGNDANWATKYDGTKQGNDSKQKAKNFTKKGGPYALV